MIYHHSWNNSVNPLSHGRYTERVNEVCRSTYWDNKPPMWQSKKYTIPKFTWNGCINPPQLEVYYWVSRLAPLLSDFWWNWSHKTENEPCMLIPFVMFVLANGCHVSVDRSHPLPCQKKNRTRGYTGDLTPEKAKIQRFQRFIGNKPFGIPSGNLT